MANANPNRLGMVQNAGDEYALFLKQYAGEVLTSFVGAYALQGKVTERNIDSGKSASFPTIGTIDGDYHTPGTEILGENVEHNEVVITLDKMLISPVFIASIDEAMNHYDVRSEYTRQQGLDLAKKRQMNELRCIIQAARQTSGPVASMPGGAVIKNTAMATDAAVLAAAIKSGRQVFDEKENPADENWCALKPAQYYLLAENKDLLDRDYNPQSNGNLADGVIYSVGGFKFVKTNHLPSTDETAAPKVLPKYRGNYADTVAVLWHKSAVGTLKLLDLALEDTYDARRQGTLMLSKFALGHGPLRYGCAIELSKSA